MTRKWKAVIVAACAVCLVGLIVWSLSFGSPEGSDPFAGAVATAGAGPPIDD